jgi:hypothetical protein
MPLIETRRGQVHQERVRRLTKHPGRMAALNAALFLFPRPLLCFLVSRLRCPNITRATLLCRVAAIIGLMPFIETSRDQVRQERVRRLTKHPGRMASLTAAVSLLPRPLLRFLVSCFDSRMDAASVEACVGLCRRDVALVAFTMAAHEFEDLSSQQGWHDLQYFASSGRCAALPAFPGDPV